MEGSVDFEPGEIIDLESNSFSLQTPISRRGTSAKDAISVENYAESRDLQLAIRASLLHSNQVIDLTEEHNVDDDDVFLINPFHSNQVVDLAVEYYGVDYMFLLNPPSSFEPGESSSSSFNKKQSDEEQLELLFVCEICTEPKLEKDLFRIKGCAHFFCSDCMGKYMAAKIQDNITSIKCPMPNCRYGVLEPQFCQSILPSRVFDRWNDALCEALILGSERFYCPFKDCSALLVDDEMKGVKESECPHCHRLFCTQCKVGWHSGIDCKEFQKLNKDERGREDLMLLNLARKNKWQRCPLCRFYVERIEGCPFMKCRCGHTFCYGCASPLKNHYCNKCRR